MTSAKTVGRITGVLMFVQLAGLIVPFVLLHPLTQGHAESLANAAGASAQIKVAIVILFANCLLTIGISIGVFPVLGRYSIRIAVWLVAASVMMFVMQAVDNVQILAMLSLSQQYIETHSSSELFQALAGAIGATRRWAHFTELLLIDLWIFSLFAVLFRFRLVPRSLAGLGVIAVLLHFIAIPLRGFLGYPLITNLGVPMGICQLLVAAWIMFRGFPNEVGQQGDPLP
jgi:hypothetical protein